MSGETIEKGGAAAPTSGGDVGPKSRDLFANSKVCSGCQTSFNLTVRRHHCRRCLASFCARCQTKRFPLPEWPNEAASRVCDTCYGTLQTGAGVDTAVQPNVKEKAMSMADKVLLAATKAKGMVEEMNVTPEERRAKQLEEWAQLTKLVPVTVDTPTRSLGAGDTRDASFSGKFVFAKHPLAVGSTNESALSSDFEYGDEVYFKAAWDRCLRDYALGVDVKSGEPMYGWPNFAKVPHRGCIHEVKLWLELTIDGKPVPAYKNAYMCGSFDVPVGGKDYHEGIAGDVWAWQRSWASSNPIVKKGTEKDNSSFGHSMTGGQRWLACQLARLDSGKHTVRAELRWTIASAGGEDSFDWAVGQGYCKQEQRWPTEAMLADMERSHVIAAGEFTINGGGLGDTEEVRDMIFPTRSVEECTERVEAAAWEYLKTSREWGARTNKREEPLYVAFTGLTGSYLRHSDSHCPQERNAQRDCVCTNSVRVYTGRCIAVFLRRERHGWDAAKAGAIMANLNVESHSSSLTAPLGFSSAGGVRPFIDAAIEPYMVTRAGLEP